MNTILMLLGLFTTPEAATAATSAGAFFLILGFAGVLIPMVDHPATKEDRLFQYGGLVTLAIGIALVMFVGYAMFVLLLAMLGLSAWIVISQAWHISRQLV